MGKITRVRTGCWTCKKRHRKCDEAKPHCNNCLKSKRSCEGYGIRLSFDVDDSRNWSRKDKSRVAFVGKPRVNLGGNTNILEKGSVSESQFSSTPATANSLSSASSPIPESHVINLESTDKKKAPQQNFLDRPQLKTRSSSANLEHFSSELFEDLELLLNAPDVANIVNTYSKSTSSNNIAFPLANSVNEGTLNLDNEIIDFIDRSNLFTAIDNSNLQGNPATDNSLYSLTYEEENMMLKHFFKKLLPLLDAHPNSPWPDLALKYCDFDIARSCFISLACIHMYESRKGGNEYYRKGMAHINNTMDHLIRYISTNNHSVAEGSLVNDSEDKKKQVSSFVILVLINVHILFAVLEKGKSSLARFFFKVFASICQDSSFYNMLMNNEKKRSLVVVLSWYDTVSAIVSPDCRLPFCSPSWYGSSSDIISTSKMMGCPGEIFKAMAKVCCIRHEIFHGMSRQSDILLKDYEEIKLELIQYRDCVLFHDGEEDYSVRLKCAQCWSLAVWITLNRVVQPPHYRGINQKLVHEFISVYGSMDPMSPMVTQMVWPVYAIGCACKTTEEKAHLMNFMETLYRNAQMGTLFSLKEIVQKVWETELSQEDFLRHWLDKGVDYLPL
ncbi:fungal-specific transcription factor domain-containing protein [Scheffersomyces xylosifermentans]|uniref:fungal-specific transcription factor domain-containing protein n=1 Tax=Scheffersomyces xylosifermentans TaxID=1304137 RepID=UPI00315DA923